MSTKRKAGNKLLEELELKLKENNYYECLQLYRTLFSRYVTKKEYDKGEKLLIDGVKIFLSKNEITSGYELISVYLKSLKDRKAAYSDEIDSILISCVIIYI